MKIWVLGVLLVGCGGQDLVPLDSDVEAVPDQVTEPAAPKIMTICADEIARELDPTIDRAIQDALLYWRDDPAVERLVWSAAGDCDVPVYFSADESKWEGTQGARARVRGKLAPGECTPRELALREAEWDRVTANDWTSVLFAHEMGHLLCHPHDDQGIMSPDGGLD